MTTTRSAPQLAKWPFLLADALLLALAWWIMARSPHPLGPWPLGWLVASVAGAAWLGVTPFLVEYRAALRFAESDQLASTVAQIGDLQSVGDQVRLATAQWQAVQEQASKAVAAAREIGDRMSTEAKGFADFIQKANDSEKSHLRLEVEKLRRVEGDWLQVAVRILDHVYALHQAGAKSSQPALKEQLGRFQFACFDAARRMGLVPLLAQAGEPFNEQHHQAPDANLKPAAGALVGETFAPGYSFQGQLLRRPIVSVTSPAAAPAAEELPDSGDAMPDANEPAAMETEIESAEFRLEPEGGA